MAVAVAVAVVVARKSHEDALREVAKIVDRELLLWPEVEASTNTSDRREHS